jgi:hypothetical protein
MQKPVGCARRQLAILAHGGNRRSGVAGIGMLMLCATSSAIMSSSIWRMRRGPRVRRDRLSQAGQGIVWGGAAIHWFGGQDAAAIAGMEGPAARPGLSARRPARR